MNLKLGDRVKIAAGVGKIVWMKPRKIPNATPGEPRFPLVDGPDWAIGVMILNPPGCPFPYYVHCAHAENAELV